MDLAATPPPPSLPPLQPRRALPQAQPSSPPTPKLQNVPPFCSLRDLRRVIFRGYLSFRPTDPVGWWRWGDRPILGGRDVEAGGTWLACSKEGKVAFLTNIRELNLASYPKSRGELPCKFLESEKSPLEFAEGLIQEADEYHGFNLIVADLCSKSMVYVCNRPHGDHCVQVLSPGLFVITNGKLGLPSPKLERFHQKLQHLLEKYGDDELNTEEMVDQLMGDKLKAGIQIPLTYGWDPDMEFKLSSIFIDSENINGPYGTRSHAALSVRLNGEAKFYERYLEEKTWKEHTVDFQIEKLQG